MTKWNQRKKELQNRVEINPEIMTGKPVIRGTRIPVGLLIKMLAQGMSTDDILEEYPHLAPEDVQAALLYAAENLEESEVFPVNPQ